MQNIFYGGTQAFDELAYGSRHPGTMQFLAQQMEQLPMLSQTLTDGGRMFVQAARQIYNEYNSEEALRAARAATRKASSMFQTNTIRSIFELGQLQHAPPIMQRYIMAEPTVRRMFHRQLCDGYAETYIDMAPGKIGDDHYDYRRVTNGILVDDPQGSDWKATIYLEDVLEGDRELTLDQQVDIIHTWDIIRNLMDAGGEDPTSPQGANL